MGSRIVLPLSIAAAVVAGGLVFWLSAVHERSVSPVEARSSSSGEEAPVEQALTRPSAHEEPEARAHERWAVEPVGLGTGGAGEPISAAQAQPNVTGRVIDRLGMPVRDARVSIGQRFEFLGDPDVARRAEGISDADGRFALDWSGSGEVQLAVRAHGFAPLGRGINVLEGAPLDVGALVLSEGAILSGHVVDATGRPVPDAELLSVVDSEMGGLVLLGGRRERVARTERDGSFRVDELACGPWKILVRSELHPERFFSGSAPDPGVETSGLLFELEVGTAITGWVTGIPEGELAGLSVRAVRAAEGEELRSGARSAKLDAQGRFELQGLAVDASYDLRLVARDARNEHFGFGRARSETRRARAGDSGVVLAYLPGACITFQVIDETTREPVEAFDVEAGIRFTQALRDENGRPLRQHPQGRVRLDDLRPAGDGELVTIHVRAPGYADLHQECKLTQGQDLDLGPLAFRRVPRVLVHVTDARTGDPIAGARVTLSKDEGGQGFVSNRRIEVSSAAEDITNGLSFGERTAVTDEKGDAVLSSFEGETCVLGVEAEGFARSERAGLALPNGRDFEQSFALTGGGDVLVRVFDAEGNPMPGAKVRHRSTSSTPLPFAPTQATDGEGKARFGGLEPGVHGFQLDESKSQGFVLDFGGGGGAGEGWTEVEVREDSLAEVELHALPRADLAGTIREGGTALVGARVSLSEARPGGRERMMMPFGGGEQTRTDGHGEYRFSDIRAGRYTLTIDHTSRAMPSEFEVEVREGDTTYDVDLPVSILEGRVTDRQGNGLAGLAVRAERVREDGHVTAQFVMITMTSDNDGDTVTLGDGSSAAGARTDADGRYSLRGVASDVELVVKASGDTVQAGQSERVTVAPDQTRSNVNIELDPAGSVEVEALQADNSAARMCLVQATYKGEGQVEPRSGLIESRSTKLTGLRPGLWRLTVERIGFGSPAEGDDKGQDVEVVAGETVRATLYVE